MFRMYDFVNGTTQTHITLPTKCLHRVVSFENYFHFVQFTANPKIRRKCNYFVVLRIQSIVIVSLFPKSIECIRTFHMEFRNIGNVFPCKFSENLWQISFHKLEIYYFRREKVSNSTKLSDILENIII